MNKKENVKKMIERMGLVKQEILKRYLDEIDLDSDIDIYDKIFEHLGDGDLDSVGEFESIKYLGEEEKEETIKKANKNIGLCYYEDSNENWLDSTEARINDAEFVAGRLLDNYNFLLKMAKEMNEEELKRLSFLQKEDGYNESSVIEYLRNSFNNDEVLREVLLDMMRNKKYEVFTPLEKAQLLKYPQGTLYLLGDDGITLSEPVSLAEEISRRAGYEVKNDDDKESKLKENLMEAEDDFFDIVVDMNDSFYTNSDVMGSFEAKGIHKDKGKFEQFWATSRGEDNIKFTK